MPFLSGMISLRFFLVTERNADERRSCANKVNVGSSNRNVGPYLPALANARGAAYKIFETIDRVPLIDSANPRGAKPARLRGHIVVTNVDFHYPSRPDVPILKKMSVEVKPGQTIALVGQSGSGKSTIVGLVERFYDPVCKCSFPSFPRSFSFPTHVPP